MDLDSNYKGPIALNNIGVDLLERRCYQQAQITLKDAALAMKLIFRKPSSESSVGGKAEDSSMLAEALEAMLQRANQRKAQATTQVEEVHTDDHYRMVNLADNYKYILNEGCEDKQSNSGSLLTESIYPIRIDDVSPDICCPEDPDVLAALLLHNLGLANLCVARQTQDHQVKTVKIGQAIYVFQCSNSILEQCCAVLEDKVEHRLALRQAVCVNMAVLLGLHRALSLCTDSFSNKAKEVHDQFCTLRSVAKSLDKSLAWFVADVKSAPAA
jgi:hypothetical protein